MEFLKQKILLLKENKNIYFGLDGEIYREDDNKIFRPEHIEDDKLNLRNVVNDSDKLRLGAIGELYAQYIMKSFGYKIFPSVVDDHGVDLIATKEKKILKIQVKTVNIGTYVFFPQKKFDSVKGTDYYILYIRVNDEGTVCTYIYPSIIWNDITTSEEDWHKGPFVFHAYKGKESESEYGIYGSNKYYGKGSEIDSLFCINTDNDWTLDKDRFERIIGITDEKIKGYLLRT